MVLFLIVRSDQEINKTLSALSVFAVQQPFAVQQFLPPAPLKAQSTQRKTL